jgi:hypothetical protein
LVDHIEGGTRLRVFENRVQRRIFGPKRDEVIGEGKQLYSEEVNYLYSSINIVRMIKSRRTRWVGIVVGMEERRGVYRILLGILRERNHLEA